MGRQQKANATHRNIVLKIKTYDRLQRFMVDLVKKKGVLRISFDEAINELLNRNGKK
jgi:hypothetical protein